MVWTSSAGGAVQPVLLPAPGTACAFSAMKLVLVAEGAEVPEMMN